MATPEAVRQAYSRVEPALQDVARYVRGTLEPYCKERGYLFTDRIKTVKSLSEKLEGGRTERWSRLDDLYACTIVVPVASHENAAIRKLDSTFTFHRKVTRSEVQKPPDVFRFDGVRWYGRLNPQASNQRQPGVSDLLFEVQVVTAFEYAWIAVTHDLVYKADHIDWKRLRLAAQLKAAVEQIEVIISAFDSASGAVEASPWPATNAGADIIARCQLLSKDGLIPDMLVPESWRRFAENVCALVGSYERNPHNLESAVNQLLDAIDRDLRGSNPTVLPVSGSLFQYVLSLVGRNTMPGQLNRFTVIPSRELEDVYGLKEIPRPFVFDLPELDAESDDLEANGD